MDRFPHAALAAALLALALPVMAADGTPRRLGLVSDPQITESSGLARSICRPGHFWTHNDSGDAARLFLLDPTGATRAVVSLDGAAAVDWEDMASGEIDGQPFLLVADVGNNGLTRDVVRLYLLREPVVPEADGVQLLESEVSRNLRFRFADGPKNCESVGIDAGSRRILLVSKERGAAGAYELPWPDGTGDEVQVARRIATLPIFAATGMDVAPDGLHAAIVTYFGGYEFDRRPGETWAEAFTRAPRALALPPRRVGESVCYGADGLSLYLTSESRGQPLWEVILRRLGPR